VPSLNLLGQALVSGVLIGGLYGLLSLGLTLSWGLLHLINIAYFGLAFLSAYLTYHLAEAYHVEPWFSALIIVPAFFALGAGLHWLLARLRVSGLVSLLVTFGFIVVIEAVIQIVWTADFRKLELPYQIPSLKLGRIYIPTLELIAFLLAALFAVLAWAALRWTYFGKAVRAAAEDPAMAASFGINHRGNALLIAGVCAASAALAGVFIALTTTLAPSQIFSWFGVVFAVVIIGGLGNPLGALIAGVLIGVAEALTVTMTNQPWAPLIAFSLLIALMIWQPRWL
jgi:branched-chain amino acid transport system permease protein